jgi:HSP20 family protein
MTNPRRHGARPEGPPKPGAPEVPTSQRQGAADEEVSVEVQETDQEVIVKIALGWVVHDSISVNCTEQTLHVEAERYVRPADTRVRPSGWRQGDVLRRTIPLPCEVCSERANARYRQGILTVRIPRRAPRSSAHRPS